MVLILKPYGPYMKPASICFWVKRKKSPLLCVMPVLGVPITHFVFRNNVI